MNVDLEQERTASLERQARQRLAGRGQLLLQAAGPGAGEAELRELIENDHRFQPPWCTADELVAAAMGLQDTGNHTSRRYTPEEIEEMGRPLENKAEIIAWTRQRREAGTDGGPANMQREAEAAFDVTLPKGTWYGSYWKAAEPDRAEAAPRKQSRNGKRADRKAAPPPAREEESAPAPVSDPEPAKELVRTTTTSMSEDRGSPAAALLLATNGAIARMVGPRVQVDFLSGGIAQIRFAHEVPADIAPQLAAAIHDILTEHGEGA